MDPPTVRLISNRYNICWFEYWSDDDDDDDGRTGAIWRNPELHDTVVCRPGTFRGSQVNRCCTRCYLKPHRNRTFVGFRLCFLAASSLTTVWNSISIAVCMYVKEGTNSLRIDFIYSSTKENYSILRQAALSLFFPTKCQYYTILFFTV